MACIQIYEFITLTTTQYYFNLSCNGWEILTNQIQINKILTSFDKEIQKKQDRICQNLSSINIKC
jgi:hypothetical protein